MILRITLLAAGLLAGVHTPLSVRDLDGRTWTLLAPTGGQVDLLFFLSPECPISNRYAPEIQRICGDYRSRGVRCFTVYPSAEMAAVKQHRQEFGLGGPAAIDHDHSIVGAVGPSVTPEAAVYSSAGRVYRGRIDDLYVDIGRSRRAPTRRDLRLALDAVLARRPVATPETEAIGCSIQTP
jgi:hypothetical protein